MRKRMKERRSIRGKRREEEEEKVNKKIGP